MPYPAPPVEEVVDDLHGEPIADPFRPLEDAADPRSVAWVQAQDRLTRAILEGLPGRTSLRERISQLWDHPRSGVPFRRGERWFQMRNSGLQSQAVLYTAGAPAGDGTVLIDANLMSADGTVSLTGVDPDPQGATVAYATSSGGSDWMTWRVLGVDGGGDHADVLEWSKFSGAAWVGDGSGFFYTAAERPRAGQELTAETRALRIAFHRLGTPQDEDLVEFCAPDEPDWIPSADVTEDGRYLVVTVTRGSGTDTYVLVRELTDRAGRLEPLTGPFEARDELIGNDGSDLYVMTDRGAERGRLMLAAPGQGPSLWTEVVPEAPETLLAAHLYGGRLVCHYLRDAHSVLTVHELDGTFVREVQLPGIVSLAGAVEGRAADPVIHFQVVSFVESGSIWSHDLPSGTTSLVSASASALDSGRYVTEQVFATSADGTRVPMFLTRERSLEADGSIPVLMYGYGGFSVPLTPSFSVGFAAWMERGGMVAVCNLRGGGEYGRSWHDAGRLGSKQNVFDDLIACCRWLTDHGWTTPGRTAVSGGSNGGLLVGACLTQHPELFGAAVADVGVFDMLRFHLFTIGWAWKSDYGDPEDPDDFRWLRAYSPLHNVRPGTCYPPVLLMTGDHDDRVVPAHSYKFAAALQRAQACAHPVLLRVESSAGHGMGKPTEKLIDEATDRLSFLEAALGGLWDA